MGVKVSAISRETVRVIIMVTGSDLINSPAIIGHGRNGHKSQNGGQGGRNHRPSNLGSSQDGSFPWLMSHLNEAVDILHHHNGVIHQHPQHHHQRCYGDLLKPVSGKIHKAQSNGQ